MSALGHWSFIEVIAHYYFCPVCPCGQCQTVVLVTAQVTRTDPNSNQSLQSGFGFFCLRKTCAQFTLCTVRYCSSLTVHSPHRAPCPSSVLVPCRQLPGVRTYEYTRWLRVCAEREYSSFSRRDSPSYDTFYVHSVFVLCLLQTSSWCVCPREELRTGGQVRGPRFYLLLFNNLERD